MQSKKLIREGKHNQFLFINFSTLYTNINHENLKFVWWELINFCIKRGSIIYIAASKFGARLVDYKKNNKIVLDKSKLKLAINYLLDNCYFTVANSSSDKWFGYLWFEIQLHSWQIFFFITLKRSGSWSYVVSRSFTNTFRFIDDVCAKIGNGFFENRSKKNCPEELELKKQNMYPLKSFILSLVLRYIVYLETQVIVSNSEQFMNCWTGWVRKPIEEYHIITNYHITAINICSSCQSFQLICSDS